MGQAPAWAKGRSHLPNDSAYTDKIITYLQQVGTPQTAPQIAEAVGLSRQGGYFWCKSTGAHLIRAVGVGENNGTAYVLREDAVKYPSNFTPVGTWTVRGGLKGTPHEDDQSTRPDFKLGAKLTVVGLRIEGDSQIVEMRAEDGNVFSVTIGE